MAATHIASLAADANTLGTLAKLFSAAVSTTKLQLMVAAPQVLFLIVRPVAFFVIMTWILGAISPTLLKYHNLLDTSAIARQLDLAYPNSSYHLFKVANWTHSGYSNLGLNNGVCKRYMSCRAGEFVAIEYPSFVGWMEKSGFLERLSFYADKGSDPYVKLAIGALVDRNSTCQEEMEPCMSWIGFEKMFGIIQPEPKPNEVPSTEEEVTVDPVEEVEEGTTQQADKLAGQVSMPTASTKTSTVPSITPSTTTSTSSPVASEIVGNAIRRGFLAFFNS